MVLLEVNLDNITKKIPSILHKLGLLVKISI